MTQTPTPVEVAFALLREGRMGDAESLMTREVRSVEDSHGEGTPEWASAQSDLGTVLLNTDQPGRAVECYRRAVSAAPRDSESHKDQLTYRLNLGLALRMAGRLEEAEAELRRGAEERLAFYGREHAGYAFGLEPLADLLRQRGDLAEARRVIEETVANFWRNGHERVGTALAGRAAIVHAAGGGDFLFPDLSPLPDPVVEQIGRAVVETLDEDDPASMTLLAATVSMLEDRLGPDHQAVLNALSSQANLGRDLGDHAARVGAIERVLASYDRQGREADALMATLGLAMAQGEAGDDEAGLRSYASAYARAERIGRPELRSQVLRNWGLALKEAGHVVPAEQRLTEALSEARRGADHDLVGAACVALGLFLQHEERLPEARTVLEEGLAVMDPVHPDAIVGRSHLGAVVDGRSCGCGDLPETIAAAFHDFVISRIPADLLDRLDVAVVDGEFKLDVALRREPEEAELKRLDEVMRTAVAEFQGRISRRG